MIIPIISVRNPNTNVHPQLSTCFLLLNEKTISAIPFTINEALKIIAKVKKDFTGVVKVYNPILIKMIPTINGIYQFFIEFFTNLKK